MQHIFSAVKKLSYDKRVKTVFALVLFLLILNANSVFALEITYPPVPGAMTPQEFLREIEAGRIPAEQTLSLYAKYFYNLSLMVGGVIALGAVFLGGTKYLISGGDVGKMKDAREQVVAGILGLIVLFASYTIISIINPNLTIFHITKPSAELEYPELPEWPEVELTSVYEELPAETSIEEVLDKDRLYYILGLACRFKENSRTLNGLSYDLYHLATDPVATGTEWPGCDCRRTYPIDEDGNRVTQCDYDNPCPVEGCGGDPCGPVRNAINNKIAEIEEVLTGDSPAETCVAPEFPSQYCAPSFYTQDFWYRYYEPCYGRIKSDLMQSYNSLLYELFRLQKIDLLMQECSMQKEVTQPLSYLQYALQEEVPLEGAEGYEIKREQLLEWRGTSIAGDQGGTFYCPKTESWTELLVMADMLAMQEKAEMGLTYLTPIPLVGLPPAPGDTCDPQVFTTQYLPKIGGYESFIGEANFAEARTGVRAPLLLALLAYESGYGQCVGGGQACTICHEQCRSRDEANCSIITDIWDELDGEHYDVFRQCGWGSVDEVQVSRCGEYTAAGETIFHCGGAMGPAQAMPGTWIRYKDRVAAITGFTPASPWEYTDAFVFAGLHLVDGGATGGSCLQEMNAVWFYVGGHSQHAVCIVELADYLAQVIAPEQGWSTCQ